jgi:hypothetical protein
VTGVASSATSVGASAGTGAGDASTSGRGAPFIRVSICSFVSGPRRYDNAQRVMKSEGVELFALTNRNSRF